MTQEEIQQKAYEVYPLDLDRHMIIEGEPYDNNREKREAYIRGLTDSKPELPPNLDEAAEDSWAVYEYRESPKGLYSTCYVDGFKAGAEWMKEQMLKEAVEADVNIYRDLVANESWAEFVVQMPTNNLGDKVRIIIVKED